VKFGVLLMHGSPFGAPQFLRLSYGGIDPSEVVGAIEKLRSGFDFINELALIRRNKMHK
jgi:hypothetical protein